MLAKSIVGSLWESALTFFEAAKVPVYFIQAENDFSISPSKELYAALRTADKPSKVKIYPPQGTTKFDGHAMGTEPGVWFAEVLPWIDKMVGQK